jgi:isoleucyl-tRNA synthetase
MSFEDVPSKISFPQLEAELLRRWSESYMESVLWAFKALHERGLTYEGEKVVPYCIRCQTSLSNFEC